MRMGPPGSDQGCGRWLAGGGQDRELGLQLRQVQYVPGSKLGTVWVVVGHVAPSVGCHLSQRVSSAVVCICALRLGLESRPAIVVLHWLCICAMTRQTSVFCL